MEENPRNPVKVALLPHLLRQFPFAPTAGQEDFFRQIAAFLEGAALRQTPFALFILKGFAGTGKTSVLAALVRVLPKINMRALLLAPTGRAAKVMGNYSGRSAFTIHKIIYRPVEENTPGEGFFLLQRNYYKNTLFIVDEASMLGDQLSAAAGNLLRDLIEFVQDGEGNQLLFVGDTAQLPPVGSTESPGLDADYLRTHFRLPVEEVLLTEVKRQAEASGILWNATALRQLLPLPHPEVRFVTKGFPDCFRMTGQRLEDGLRYAYEKYGVEQTIIITRSNRAAVQYNGYIRRVIHFFEEEIEAGDFLMIVKNNYMYMADSDQVNFLANGDFVEVMKIRGFETQYGLRFATLELRLVDYPEEPYFEAKVLLDVLASHAPSLEPDAYRALYKAVAEDYMDVASKVERRDLIRKDPFLNALQVKFAYTLTCHKAQGGQWDAVFVDQGFLPETGVDREFIRWLYTAITRARKELYFVNFKPEFFGGSPSSEP
ncbi:MAG: ATP-dependent DNA helicase [Nitritalea sp.]